MIQQIHIALNVCNTYNMDSITLCASLVRPANLRGTCRLEEREPKATVGLTNGRGSNGIDRLHDGHYTCSSARIYEYGTCWSIPSCRLPFCILPLSDACNKLPCPCTQANCLKNKCFSNNSE